MGHPLTYQSGESKDESKVNQNASPVKGNVEGMGVRSVPSSPSPRFRLLETGDRVFLRRLAG